MINTTRWSPDTCDCVLEYSWDTEVSEDQRVHTPTNVVRKCEEHKTKTNQEVHIQVKNENIGKNVTLQEIADRLPSHAKVDEKGNKNPDLDKIKWSFNAERKLQIELLGAKKADKDSLKAVLDLNKVDIL